MEINKYNFINGMARTPDRDFFNACAKRVRDFNYAARGEHKFTKESIAFQKSLVKEELIQELLVDGLEGKNRKLIIDALCDIFVVASYWDFINLLSEIKEEDPYAPDESIIKRAEQDVRSAFETSLRRTTPAGYVDYMVNYYNSDYPDDLVSECVELMTILDFDYRVALSEVLNSNDSKIPTVEDFLNQYRSETESLYEAILLEARRIQDRSKGRYVGVHGQAFDGRVVFKDSNGKIMKPCTFFEPNLEGL